MTQTIINLGTGGALLNGQNGSTAGADSNDARFLEWPGDNGGNYVYLPGVVGNSLQVPDEDALDITGDIDLRARIALDSYAAGSQDVIGKNTNSGNQRSYVLRVNSARALVLVWTTDGTNADIKVAGSTATIAASDGERIWVRATLDVDNGASGRDIQFFTSDDGVTWTQLGATVTQAGTTSIYSGTSALQVGARGDNTNPVAGKVYRAQVLDGIDGTTVLDVDTSVISSGSATSFTALTGQTVTINRSTSGRKSVAVVSPVWLFGTDDYMEVADNSLLDFGASEPLTVLAIHRVWGTQGTNDTLVAKKANTTNTTQGWSVSGGSSTALAGQAQIGDGSAGITATSSNRVVGELTVLAAVRDVAADTLTVIRNGSAGSPVTDTTTGSLSNAEVLRIARLSGAGTEYSDMELVGVAVFRRALTATEITAITTYYQARLS
jgi:hypothetical protein